MAFVQISRQLIFIGWIIYHWNVCCFCCCVIIIHELTTLLLHPQTENVTLISYMNKDFYFFVILMISNPFCTSFCKFVWDKTSIKTLLNLLPVKSCSILSVMRSSFRVNQSTTFLTLLTLWMFYFELLSTQLRCQIDIIFH